MISRRSALAALAVSPFAVTPVLAQGPRARKKVLVELFTSQG
jgi:hypothetical protein